MKPEKFQFVDLSRGSAPENRESGDNQLKEILNLTREALMIVAQIVGGKSRDEKILIYLNNKIRSLLLAQSAAKPADILKKPENDAINAIKMRSQPGIEEVLAYGGALYVSVKSRIYTNYYEIFLKNPPTFKKNFLNEYYSLLKRFIESGGVSVLLDLHALSKSFLDQGVYKIDRDFGEIGEYCRKIYGFCNINLETIMKGEGLPQCGLEEILVRLEFLIDQDNFNAGSNN